jgi:predicted unusual protein kinase regulating ubiquinone biosynthesis (AarF/ABC1/UbiB family)
MAEATAGHPRFTVPPVRLATRRVLVSDWVEGAKLTSLVGRPDAVRNAAGLDYVTFLFAGPSLGGVLHGDPHPGNFLVAADDRLAVVDFGLVSRMPNGLPAPMGRLIRQAVDHDADAMLDGLVAEGFIRPGDASAADLLDYLNPFVEPARTEQFRFNREWTRAQFRRVHSQFGPSDVAMKLNIPPEYSLIYRVWLGGIAVLAQLDVTAGFADVLRRYLPGFAD